MNRLFLFGLGIMMWGLVSCTDKDKIPPGVLGQDKMEKVLWDMIQAERYTNTFMKDSAQNIKEETFKLYAQVFSIHNISKDQFIKSYKFYMSRPDIARPMFDSLATKANRRREEMYKGKTPSTTEPQPPANQPQPAPSQPAQPQPVQPQATPAQPVKPMLKDPQLRKRLPLRHLKKDSLLRRGQ
jgi:hypothetical protein